MSNTAPSKGVNIRVLTFLLVSAFLTALNSALLYYGQSPYSLFGTVFSALMFITGMLMAAVGVVRR